MPVVAMECCQRNRPLVEVGRRHVICMCLCIIWCCCEVVAMCRNNAHGGHEVLPEGPAALKVSILQGEGLQG